MGRRGPRPTPTSVLRARGSRRANDRKSEPVVPPGRPECPDWLDPEAKQVWAQLVPILEEMAVLTKADLNPLARYCQLFIRWKRAELFIQQYGETYPVKSARGQVKCFFAWPQVGIAHKLSQALTRLEQEFGLSPSARTHVEVDRRFTMSEQSKEFYDTFLAPRPLTPRPPNACTGDEE
jgi:P27 family predicted phage terminase small subunit